jgi:chloramphenicol 3-O-phosphotransferase
MNPVLFLNGTSSVGKTSVARRFQKLWHEPSLYASIDSFIFMFPDHVLKDDEVRPEVLWPSGQTNGPGRCEEMPFELVIRKSA